MRVTRLGPPSIKRDTITVGGVVFDADDLAPGITVEDEGTPLATLGTTLDFVGAGVVASGTGVQKTITIPGGGVSLSDATPLVESGSGDSGTGTEASRDDHVHPEFGGGGGVLGLPDIIQAADNSSGVGTPTLTIAEPATDSLIIVIGAVNGTGPSSLSLTNFTMTEQRDDGFGGVGNLFIYTGEYDGSGTPGTSITFTGMSSALSSALMIEVAASAFGSLGSSSVYAGTTGGNRRMTGRLNAAAGSIVAFILHTAGTSATGAAILSCPFVGNVTDSGQALALGFAINGLPVVGYYSPAAAQAFTLAEIILA